MNYSISNSRLSVSVSTFGAELQSIKSIESGHEYLWQGLPEYWEDRSPTLFPYIGRLVNGAYTVHGTRYEMDIHGFAPKSEFEVLYHDADRIGLRLCDSSETKSIYPYCFSFNVHYALKDNALVTRYEIENKDAETMYFAIGGHPGINIPLDEATSFEDWRIRFDSACKPVMIGLDDDCFITGCDVPYTLLGDNAIPLKHNLFDHDAIILKDSGHELSLVSDKSGRSLHFIYGGFDYIGFWHATKTDAPYVCLEPWSSLPARSNTIEEFTTHPSLLHLEPAEAIAKEWKIEIIE